MHVFFAGGVASHELANLNTVQIRKGSYDYVKFNMAVSRFFKNYNGVKPPGAVKKKHFECARGGVPKLGAKMPWSSADMLEVRLVTPARNERVTMS